MYTRLRNCNNEVIYIILHLCNDCAPVKTLAIKKLSEVVILKKVKAYLHTMIALNAVIITIGILYLLLSTQNKSFSC